MNDTRTSSLTYNIQDAEIEISLAIGCIEWAKTRLTIPQSEFLSEHLAHRIMGLEQALMTIKKVKAYLQESERCSEKEPNDE